MRSSLSLNNVGDILNATEVQRVLGIGRNATYELLASGKLPSIRITPRRIVVTKQALEAFLGLASNTLHTAPDVDENRAGVDRFEKPRLQTEYAELLPREGETEALNGRRGLTTR
jgi:predicted DNA-binding transcriptional regulator AlpA